MLEDTASLVADFFDTFLSNASLYNNICNIIGDETEKDVYEYFKLKNSKQVRPVLLSLKIKQNSNMIIEKTYHELLTYLKQFFIAFNLENNSSNKVEKDIYTLANNIYNSANHFDIRWAVIDFLNKYIIYYNSVETFTGGLARVAFSNRTTKRTHSSSLLIHFFKPIVLAAEKNKFMVYNFETFNIEHILNDSDTENSHFELGNLLPCPETLNKDMENKDYSYKRTLLKDSEIGYLVKFTDKFKQFNIPAVKRRTNEISKQMVQYHKLDHVIIENEYKKLKLAKELINRIEQEYGKNNKYREIVIEKGVDGLISYIKFNKKLLFEEKTKLNDILVEVCPNSISFLTSY